jgi:ABC-type lipoprotein export system ATPase subunit
VLADEPSGSLDPESVSVVLAVPDRLHRERQTTIVMVTHDTGVATSADRAVRCENGHLTEVKGADERAGDGPLDVAGHRRP